MTHPTHTIPAKTRAHLDLGQRPPFTPATDQPVIWDGTKNDKTGIARVITPDGTPLLVHHTRLVTIAIEGGTGTDEPQPARATKAPPMDRATYEAIRAARQRGDRQMANGLEQQWRTRMAEAQTRARVEACTRLAEQEIEDSAADIIIAEHMGNTPDGGPSGGQSATLCTKASTDAGLRSLIDVAPAWKPHPLGHIVKVPSFNPDTPDDQQPYTVEMNGHIAKSCSCDDWHYRRRRFGGDIRAECRRCKHGELVEEWARGWWEKCRALREAGWSLAEIRRVWLLVRSKHGVLAGSKLWVEREFGRGAGVYGRLRRAA